MGGVIEAQKIATSGETRIAKKNNSLFAERIEQVVNTNINKKSQQETVYPLFSE